MGHMVEINRLRHALRYVERSLTDMLEYAKYSALDDFVPDIELALTNMRRLAQMPGHIMTSSDEITCPVDVKLVAHNPHEIVILDPDQ